MHARGGEPVRGYARPFTLEQLQAKFHYAFFGRALYRATVEIAPLPDMLVVGDIRITVADQPHGGITSAGLRFDSHDKSIGYATDFHEMTSDMRALYRGLDVWVVDALRRAPHPTHPDLASVLEWVGSWGPNVPHLFIWTIRWTISVLRPSCPRGSSQAMTAGDARVIRHMDTMDLIYLVGVLVLVLSALGQEIVVRAGGPLADQLGADHRADGARRGAPPRTRRAVRRRIGAARDRRPAGRRQDGAHPHGA